MGWRFLAQKRGEFFGRHRFGEKVVLSQLATQFAQFAALALGFDAFGPTPSDGHGFSTSVPTAASSPATSGATKLSA